MIVQALIITDSKLEMVETYKFITNGSNSRIHDNGTGILAISGSQIDFQSANQGESLLQAVQNGAVSLRFDNSTKLETITTGVTVTGDVNITDDLVINSGNAQQILRDFY